MDEKASPAAAIVIQPPENQQAEVIALQPVAVVDHLCSVTEEQLRAVLAQEQIGGSRRISQQQVQDMLAHVGEFHSKAGGSNANTIRGGSLAPQLSPRDPCLASQAAIVMSSRVGSRLWCPLRTGEYSRLHDGCILHHALAVKCCCLLHRLVPGAKTNGVQCLPAA